MSIYSRTSACFANWNLPDSSAADRLVDDTCEHIANYCAHAFVVKYPHERRKLAHDLMQRQDILALFEKYQNKKHSKFMLLFTLGLRLRLPVILFTASNIVQRKIRQST